MTQELQEPQELLELQEPRRLLEPQELPQERPEVAAVVEGPESAPPASAGQPAAGTPGRVAKKIKQISMNYPMNELAVYVTDSPVEQVAGQTAAAVALPVGRPAEVVEPTVAPPVGRNCQ